MRQPESDRQSTLDLNTQTSVGIVGVGGVGSWCALALLKAGVRVVHLWDHDTVAISNLHRTPFTLAQVGKLKTESIAELTGDPEGLVCHGRWSEALAPHQAPSLDWVICALDSHPLRQAVYKWSQSIGAIYIDAAAEGHNASVSDAPALVVPSDEHTGYDIVPQWIGPQLFAATMAATYVLYNQPPVWHLYEKGSIR